MGRLTVSGWFGLATAALAVIAAVAIVAGGVAIANLSDARARVVGSLDPASLSVQTVLDAYLNEETGVRGYALTGRPSTLAPYTLGRRQLPGATRALRRAIAPLHDRILNADVAAVVSAGSAWAQRYAASTIGTVRTGAPVPSADATLAGKARFDRLRTQVARLQSHLQLRTAQAKDRLSSAARVLSATFVVIGLLLVLGGAAILLGLRAIVSRPVARLARRTRRVADGDFEAAVRAEGPRDIAGLGRDVESMRRRIVHELAVVERARDRLEDQSEELERSNAELEQFAYVASHDLQEPLRKVASFTQLLHKRYSGQLDERADQYIDFAVDGATRMQQLINDLLAFSRVGRVAAQDTADFGADEALRQALLALEDVISASGALVDHEPLPRVRGELSLIAAVFQNLIGNAIKFAAADRAPHIHIDAQAVDGMWQFTCADNGIGIDDEYADRIFMIFQRLHPKDVYPGTGIGLAMCRKIIEYHGGTIWLQRDVAAGSTFHFTLPALPQEETHVPDR